MTYCAIVKYPVDAVDGEKRRLLREGLADVCIELVDLGYNLDDIETALDDARSAAEFEIDTIEYWKKENE